MPFNEQHVSIKGNGSDVMNKKNYVHGTTFKKTKNKKRKKIRKGYKNITTMTSKSFYQKYIHKYINRIEGLIAIRN